MTWFWPFLFDLSDEGVLSHVFFLIYLVFFCFLYIYFLLIFFLLIFLYLISVLIQNFFVSFEKVLLLIKKVYPVLKLFDSGFIFLCLIYFSRLEFAAGECDTSCVDLFLFCWT